MVSDEHKKALQRKYNRRWYARYMSNLAVRKRHYEQNRRWYIKHRADARKSMTRSAFGTWFMFTSDVKNLKLINNIADKRMKQAKANRPFSLPERPRKQVPQDASMQRYRLLVINLVKSTDNQEVLKLAKLLSDDRLKVLKNK